MKKLVLQYWVKQITVYGYVIKRCDGGQVYYNLYARWNKGNWKCELYSMVTIHTYPEAVAACREMMDDIKNEIEKEVK